MIVGGLTDSFRQQALNGEHLASHQYGLALFTSAASLSPATARYRNAGECQGTPYPQGGFPLSGRKCEIDRATGSVCISWDNIEVAHAEIRDVAGALIYNRSLPGQPSVAVIKFPTPFSASNGPLRIPLEKILEWPR